MTTCGNKPQITKLVKTKERERNRWKKLTQVETYIYRTSTEQALPDFSQEKNHPLKDKENTTRKGYSLIKTYYFKTEQSKTE
jgi:hypothetical protein